MVRLQLWQWLVLVLPIVAIAAFLLTAAGWQIHAWGLNWIWGVVILMFVIWRWLLVKWTSPVVKQVEALMAEVDAELSAEQESTVGLEAMGTPGDAAIQRIEARLQHILNESQADPPLWEDGATFWKRCREVVSEVAHVYHPEVKYPLLNIYVPQAYGLIRGTVDDMDLWMQKLTPVLGQVTVGQAYEAYEVYQKLEPSARKLWRAWNWAQWVLNPAAAVARTATRQSSDRATQQLLVNLGQMLRETALRTLCRQAIALYSGEIATQTRDVKGGKAAIASGLTSETKALPSAKTQTLQAILEQAEPTEQVQQKPLRILLIGRTGAGKSSLVNTVFQADRAEVDVLPSTDQIKTYHWQAPTGDALDLMDTPGYEQIDRSDFRDEVLDYAHEADLVLLVTPALDPALQMDADFLKDLRKEAGDRPIIGIVTQVDRLRPIREWEPPYDWQWGERPKERAIREATQYRAEQLGDLCDWALPMQRKRILPLVTADAATGRAAWNADILALTLIESVDPAKELRLARFLRDRQARASSAARSIDHYIFQMSTTQGLTALLKSPVLKFISTLTTGSPTLAYLLAEQIPVEQLPIVIGKLQMAYDLFSLLSTDRDFDLLSLWPLLLDTSSTPDRNAWAFGHALVEYWTQDLTIAQLKRRFNDYLDQPSAAK